MRVYLEIARLAAHQQVAYRSATLAGLFTNSVFGVLLASVMLGFYGALDGGTVAGWSADEAVTQIWINQSLLLVLYIWGWWEVSLTIQSGSIASDFLRPTSWYGLWLFRDVGRAVVALFMRMVPTLAIGSLLFDLAPPPTLWHLLLFLTAVTLGTWVSFSIRMLINLSSFWLIDHRGIAAIWISVSTFLSGMIMPIDFFPEPLRTIAAILPFQAMNMAPANAWLGRDAGWVILGTQALWVVLLTAGCFLVLRRGERKLVVQGG